MSEEEDNHFCHFPLCGNYGELKELYLGAIQLKRIVRCIDDVLANPPKHVGEAAVTLRHFLLSAMTVAERPLTSDMKKNIDRDIYYKDMMRKNEDMGWEYMHEPPNLDERYRAVFGDCVCCCGPLVAEDGRWNWYGQDS